MGLGKTASSVVASGKAGHARILVVCPEAAIPDWQREIHDWDTQARPVRVLHADSNHPPHMNYTRGWTIINYEGLEKYAAELRHWVWDLLILDEGHAVKEPESRRTILVFGGMWKGRAYSPIPCKKALVISGTPLKNRLEELFTTLNFLAPDHWPDHEVFINDHYEATTDNDLPRLSPEMFGTKAPRTSRNGQHPTFQTVPAATALSFLPVGFLQKCAPVATLAMVMRAFVRFQRPGELMCWS